MYTTLLNTFKLNTLIMTLLKNFFELKKNRIMTRVF